MGYKHFRIVCTFRVLLLGVTMGLFFWMLQSALNAVAFVAGAMILYQIYSLIRYVDKTNRDLKRFLEAITYEDFSQTFVGATLGSSFTELRAAFNEILRKFQQTRAEKEEHHRYLQTVVEHVGIGLISFRQDGEVELINKAAKKMLRVSRLKNIHSLESFSKNLVDVLFRMKAGEKELVKVEDDDDLLQFVVFATELLLREKKYTLVSIQNIQSELEEKEMEAWQNLIRVLTHEIMNSVTPIASLASTANTLLTGAFGKEDGDEAVTTSTVDDVRSAVQTIQKRSQGLLQFVDSYRKLTRIPSPNFQIFPVVTLFRRIQQLMSAQVADKNVCFTCRVDPETLELTADSELIEQVLINLLLNAMDAARDNKKAQIALCAKLDDRGRVVIQVIDNGQGILQEVQEKIFIPFFTTKKEGSGIGLSLSRQIMRLHRGTIGVHSKLNVETVFTLRF